MIERRGSKLGAGALLGWATMSLTACNVYDGNRLPPPSNGNPNDSGLDANAADGSDAAISCQPRKGVESCNGIDDDCDGITDEHAAATADCMQRLVHTIGAACNSGKCFFGKNCEPGYRNADGNPGNGCETKCDNMSCNDDAGMDDGGADDAG